MRTENQIKNMRKGVLLLSFIAVFSVMSMPSFAYIRQSATDWDDVASANYTMKWNVIELEAGLNSYAIYPCPTLPVAQATSQGLSEVLNWIRYTNTTGDYYWYEVYHPDNNLTELVFDEYYDINLSSATHWVCPCEVTGEWNENEANVFGFLWYGESCDLCQFSANCGGTTDGYYPACAGVVNHTGGSIWWEDQQSGNWYSWYSYLTPNTLSSINESQVYYWNPNANLTDPFSDVHMTWDFGITCFRTIGEKLIVHVKSDAEHRGINLAMVNATHVETGTTIIGYTNVDGRVDFNLTLDGEWEIFAAADGYVHLYPSPVALIIWEDVPMSVGIVMRQLTSEESGLNVRVCHYNTTWNEDLQTWSWGMVGYSVQSGSVRCIPIKDARVTVTGNGSTHIKYTGSEGHAVFVLNHSYAYYVAANRTGYTQISPEWNTSVQLNDSDYRNYNIIMIPTEQVEGEVIPLEDQMETPLVNMPFGEAGWVGLLFTPVSIITMFLVGIGAWFEAQVRSKGAIFCLVLAAGALLFTYLGFYPTWVGLVLVMIASGVFVWFIKGVAGR